MKENEEYLNEGNTVSFGQDTATMFYQERPYFTGDKIKILQCKYTQFSKQNAIFIVLALEKAFSSFSWGASSFNVKIIEETKITLPTHNEAIDFAFMETFIAELEAQRIAELEAYLTVTGLKDYTLTEEEEETLNNLDKVQWKEYKIVDIFNVKNTNNILSAWITPDSGEIPYLSASQSNNSVASYIEYNRDMIDKGNSIFIGGKTLVISYQEQDYFSNDSHNLALYIKDGKGGEKKSNYLW